MGLRPYQGGFGTPEFEGRVARVDGTLIVQEGAGGTSSRTISSVRDTVEFFGQPYEEKWFEGFRDPLTPIDPDQPLEIRSENTVALAHWLDFAWKLLTELQGHAQPDDDVSEIQLWPEHFDPAIELGSQDRGQRASYGASPGDVNHLEPYVYVASWSEIDRSEPYWNDESFNGSSFAYRDLLVARDPVAAALDFFLNGHRLIHGLALGPSE
jgi:hypothetical protein